MPDVNAAPMPRLAPEGPVFNGQPCGQFPEFDGQCSFPDGLAFRRKLGLLVPATNTSMEHELWHIIARNREQLEGVGLHTVPVSTPRPLFGNPAELQAYQRQFLEGLQAAVAMALLAQPEYLIMGMSLEHILPELGEIRALMAEVEMHAGLSCATWHDAAAMALRKLNVRRIGLLTPFEAEGNRNAERMFGALGAEVICSFGFACSHAMHIAHIPDVAKERAITELLARPEHRLDAIVQCGTNMSLSAVSERLEPRLGIPVLGINAVTFWYALRENGFNAPLQGGGMLLSEC